MLDLWFDLQLTYFYFWSTYDFVQRMTRYDCQRLDEWFFSNIRTDFNFIFGKFYVARKFIFNGGAIRPTGLLFSLVIHMSALWWGLTALKFSFTWVWHKGPPKTPLNMKNKYIFSYFGFKLKNFLSDCFLIWHVHRYGWEDSWKARWGPPK